MKICPYCNSSIPEKKEKCPSCGAVYWEPEQNKLNEKIETKESEEGRGCLLLVGFALYLLLSKIRKQRER
jgi:hypothetical protein